MPWASRGVGGRRARHDSRTERFTPINAVDDAIANGAIQRHQDLIIALALEHDEIWRQRRDSNPLRSARQADASTTLASPIIAEHSLTNRICQGKIWRCGAESNRR